MSIAAVLAAAAGGGALVWRWRRDQRVMQRWRAGLLQACESGFEHVRAGTDRTGFPTLSGRVAGLPMELSLILDAAGYRKLPILWLSALCPVRLRTGGACFDALAREQGTEFFSPSARLPVRLEPDPRWPPGITLRADREAQLPAEVVEAGAAFFAMPESKELVISPRGVRMVRRVGEATRSEYLVLRQAHFDLDRIDAAVVAQLTRSVTALVRPLMEVADRG